MISPAFPRGHLKVSLDPPGPRGARPRVMAMVLACASMLFSTNSAMALSGLLCESAMIRIAFQSSPIRNLPLSDFFDLAALVFATVTRNSTGRVQEMDPLPQPVISALSIARAQPQSVISHSFYRG